jgi:hypothetical protein
MYTVNVRTNDGEMHKIRDVVGADTTDEKYLRINLINDEIVFFSHNSVVIFEVTKEESDNAA